MAVSKEDVRNLIRLFEDSDWNEMRLEVEGLKLMVSKTAGSAAAAVAAPAAVAPAAVAVAAAATSTASAPVAADTTLAAGQVLIMAPNLGVFWKQPKPGESAYVQIGENIEAGTTVCLIEVMKLFTPVKAGLAGRIVRCLVEDGDMVEHDTPLFVVQQ